MSSVYITICLISRTPGAKSTELSGGKTDNKKCQEPVCTTCCAKAKVFIGVLNSHAPRWDEKPSWGWGRGAGGGTALFKCWDKDMQFQTVSPGRHFQWWQKQLCKRSLLTELCDTLSAAGRTVSPHAHDCLHCSPVSPRIVSNIHTDIVLTLIERIRITAFLTN